MVSAPWSNLFGSAWVKEPSNDLSTELTKNSNILVTQRLLRLRLCIIILKLTVELSAD